MNFIGNPVFPYTYFFLDTEDKTACVLISYGTYDRKRFKNLDALCEHVKSKFGLRYIDYAGYRDGVSISVEHLPLLYDIVNEFLAAGDRVFMNDSTEVTFSVGEKASHESQQRHMLEYPLELEKKSKKSKADAAHLESLEDMQLGHLPVHRDAFWTLPEGKAYAARLRKRWKREDKADPIEKGVSLGEFYTENEPFPTTLKRWKVAETVYEYAQKRKATDENDNSQEPSTKKQKEENKEEEKEEPELCMICEKEPRNTFVLPCSHSVVCKQCSKTLKERNDFNSLHCIYCRGAIDAILEE